MLGTLRVSPVLVETGLVPDSIIAPRSVCSSSWRRCAARSPGASTKLPSAAAEWHRSGISLCYD